MSAKSLREARSEATTMPIIDLNQWSFKFGSSHPDLVGYGLAHPQSFLQFPDAVKLLLYRAGAQRGNQRFRGAIHRRLKANPKAKAWHRQRSFLQDLFHFPRRRGRNYEAYHDAARNLARGTSTAQQTSRASGLNSEIAASKIVAPTGQVLFHGRADDTAGALALRRGRSGRHGSLSEAHRWRTACRSWRA
jgi:hypothetical protein